MLQRTLLRSSRQLRSRIPSSQPVSSHFRTQPSPSPFIRLGGPSSNRFAVARWYSDAAASPKQEAKQAEGEKIQEDQVLKAGTNTASSSEASSSNAELEKLRTELEAKKKEIINLKDSYMRQVADYRNLQDRTARDRQQAHDFALQKFARDLIPSIDNLTHALNSVPQEKLSTAPTSSDATTLSPEHTQLHSDLVNLHKGVQLMETVLLDVLKKHGMVKYDPASEGVKFDPNVHDAVFMAPQPDKEDGIVFHTQTPGYMLNGRVLRAAQVGVVKNS